MGVATPVLGVEQGGGSPGLGEGPFCLEVQAPLAAPWPDRGPESLRSPCCGLAICKAKPVDIVNLMGSHC
ncbi:hypothetical protein PoB_004629700 [Plakobranchus ocellatus]|uniref:Uncharacterized protein n=1 Tax=Plakobranchus ocellatus TaxID=259542 RepID=A0AAV4BKF4_9GAST|nr:hypothetical protein PoB_004629700 [Plakobranchus ocellatus]